MLIRRSLAIALVATLTWLGSAACQSTVPATKLYLDAVEYVKNANYSEALPLLRQAVTDSAEFLEAQYNLGVTYDGLGVLDSARIAFEKVLSLDSTYVNADLNLGTIDIRTQDYPAAISHLRKVIELDSTLVDSTRVARSYLNLGVALDATNDLDGAIGAFKRSIQLRPDNADAYYRLGAAQFRKAATAKDYPEVIETYKKALELGPTHVNASVAHFFLARMYAATGQNELAVASADEAIKMKPDLAQAYFVKGKALEALGKQDDAVAAYKKAIEKNANYGSAHYALGRIYQKREQWELALKEYKAVAKDTSTPETPAASKAAKSIEDYLKQTAAQKK